MLSRPIERLTQPLRAARSSSSGSRAMLIVLWLAHLSLQRDHGAEELLGGLRMGDRIVVEEEDAVARRAP